MSTPARSRTCRRSDRGIASRAIGAAFAADLRFHCPQGLPPAASQLRQCFDPRGIQPLDLLRQRLVLSQFVARQSSALAPRDQPLEATILEFLATIAPPASHCETRLFAGPSKVRERLAKLNATHDPISPR
jgi:hypothetical protein